MRRVAWENYADAENGSLRVLRLADDVESELPHEATVSVITSCEYQHMRGYLVDFRSTGTLIRFPHYSQLSSFLIPMAHKTSISHFDNPVRSI